MSGKVLTGRVSAKAALAAPCMVAFSCGVILLYWQTLLPPYPWLLVLIAAVVLILRPWRGCRLVRLWLPVCCCLAGLAWASWHAESRLGERLPADLEGERVSVSGMVCSLPQPGSFGSLRFDFCVRHWHGLPKLPDGTRLPDKLRLAWYGQEGRSLPDHRLRLDVVLKRPHGNLNDAGFRYESWLFRHGFRATGSVKSAMPEPALACTLECRYRFWHQEAARTVEQWFGRARQFPLVESLLIGNRGNLEAGHWETLRATGTIHLVAISGLHLGLVAVGVGLLGRRLTLLVPAGLMTGHQSRAAVFVLVVLCSLMYALLAGFTVPTRRALIMVIAGGWYLLLARQGSAWQPFLLALSAVLLMDPFAPLDQGFWLSFTAVAVLLLVFAGRVAGPGWLKGLVLAQLAVFAGLWPVLVQFGQGQPLAGLLANLVAIPWVSLVVMPILFIGALLAMVSGGVLAGLAGSLMDSVLTALWVWLEWVQGQPSVAAAEGRVVRFGLLTVLVLLALRVPIPYFRTLALVVIALWGALGMQQPERGNASVPAPEVRVMDVGQGLSVLVRVGNKVLLYDTGPEVKGVFSAAESVLVPGMRALGIRRIDQLVISHADNDHAGGLQVLLDALEVGRISSGEAGVLAARIDGSMPVEGCLQESVHWDDVVMQFWQSPSSKPGNDASCVLRISHGPSAVDVWLTGDISDRVEARMLADPALDWFDTSAGYRVVLAPHHGSKTSSSGRWVEAVKPDLVIYTAGYRHRFGHPHPEVTARYRAVEADGLNTACSGQVVIRFTGSGPEIAETRRSAPFWIAAQGLARDQCKIP